MVDYQTDVLHVTQSVYETQAFELKNKNNKEIILLRKSRRQSVNWLPSQNFHCWISVNTVIFAHLVSVEI